MREDDLSLYLLCSDDGCFDGVVVEQVELYNVRSICARKACASDFPACLLERLPNGPTKETGGSGDQDF